MVFIVQSKTRGKPIFPRVLLGLNVRFSSLSIPVGVASPLAGRFLTLSVGQPLPETLVLFLKLPGSGLCVLPTGDGGLRVGVPPFQSASLPPDEQVQNWTVSLQGPRGCFLDRQRAVSPVVQHFAGEFVAVVVAGAVEAPVLRYAQDRVLAALYSGVVLGGAG